MSMLLIYIALLAILLVMLAVEILIVIELVRVHRGDVPYVPSTTAIIETVIAANALPKEGMILDLGCGDGKALRMFAHAGYAGPFVGYERAPYPWFLGTVLSRVKKSPVRLHRKNFQEAPIAEAHGVYLFLLEEVLAELAPLLAAKLRPGTPVVSAEFKIPGWTPERVLTAKGITSKEAKVFFYRIP